MVNRRHFAGLLAKKIRRLINAIRTRKKVDTLYITLDYFQGVADLMYETG